MAANGAIGVKAWRNYSSFSLFAAGSQRADRNTSILVDTYSGNLSVLATDWNLAARVPCSLTRTYNSQDTDVTSFDRPFGPGWTWQFDMNLTGSMNGTGNVTWKAADGSEYEFTYAAGPVWTAPAGMHKYKLTYNSSPSPDEYYLKVGRMTYTFRVNTADSRARLMSIRDAFGNGIDIVRGSNGSGEPTAVITAIQIRYYSAGWQTHTIVTPTYTTYNGEPRITMLRLEDSVSGGNYIDLHYSYSSSDIASFRRLEQVEPKRGSSAMDMEIKYSYEAGAGLLVNLYDTLGAKNAYYWALSYSSSKVSSIVFPIDSAPTTGTVSYTYNSGAPSGWSHSTPVPDKWNKVTDARGNDWFYGQDSSGRVVFAVSAEWVNSSYEAYTEYAYNGDNQVTSVKVPKPNAESGQLTTSYYYNSNKNLAAVVDAYGFVSWYKYGSRASYDDSGTGATVDEVIGSFALKPNQQAYSDSDHTSSETAPPSLSSPLNVDSFVDWNNNAANEWAYIDGNSSAVLLVRTVMDYTFNTGTGQLTQLRSASPENFDEGTATSYTLTGASACSQQVFDTTIGDVLQSYTPRQFMNGALGYTAYTYDATHGVVTFVEAADSVANSASKKTAYTYNALKTRVTKVALPEDNTNQWTQTIYDEDRLYSLSVQRPDIQSWGVDPIVSVTEYDYNGNAMASWQAKPGGTPADWDGNTGGGGYDQVMGYTYDRLNRLIQSDTYVDLSHHGTPDTLTSTFKYDANGNRTISRTPGYDVSGTTNYGYIFTEYDKANRVTKVYNQFADTNASLSSFPGTPPPYVSYAYDVAGNTKTVFDQLYTSGSYHKADYTFDWLNRQIKVSQAFTTTGTGPRETRTHFAADGGVWFSEDGEGYKMWPIRDDNGRLISMYRGTQPTQPYPDAGVQHDLREYDFNGNLLYYYDYVDVMDNSGDYRVRSEFDMLDRQVNSGRERRVATVWQDWNSNLADATFNYNGWALKSFDKVNSAGTYFTERSYDDWGQLTQTDYPQVTNSSGSGNSIYNTQSVYDVLGRRTTATDMRSNDTVYVYDELGRAIEVTDAESYTTTTYFDERGNTAQVDVPAGASTKYTYNERNLLEKTRVSHDSTDDDTDYSYDDIGRVSQVSYPDGGESQTTYDQIGRKQRTRTLLSGTDYLDTDYEYDNNNRMKVLTMPGSYTQSYDYDDLGNMTQSTDTNGDDTDYSYDKNNRRITETQPNGLVTTWNYTDWKTQRVGNVLYERNTTSGDDIQTYYSYDSNGRATAIQDGRGNSWSQSWDAMGRRLTLVTPNPGGGAFTHYMYYDGNGNIAKTTDFKATSHYYAYDGLNRMTGHGSSSGANDETYSWGCCSRLSAYTDALGTSDLQYDQLGRLTSHQDSNGNTVAYEYDSMGRTVKITPAQGTNYRTEYVFNKNGSVDRVKIYVGGSNIDTTYAYDTTSGKLTQRNDPPRSGDNIRITYAYDSAGRLDTETVTRENGGGTTNLYKTTYGYSYIAAGSGGGRAILRTEQTYSGGWVNDNKVNYKLDALGRQTFEERHDWALGSWSQRYDISQEYDKNGNRTRYHRNVTGGFTASYGVDQNLTYTYDSTNRLTAGADGDVASYVATFTCDANGNITQIEEAEGPSDLILGKNKVFTYFTMDALNRVIETKTKKYIAGGTNDWQWTKIVHIVDAIGRTAKSTWKQWLNGGSEPGGNTLEHVYDSQGRMVQNYDGTSTYGATWRWAGAANAHNGPLWGPAADTASQVNHNIGAASFKGIPVRRSFTQPTTEGDKRELFGQGRPQAKDSVSAWNTGIQSSPQSVAQGIATSRFSFIGTVSSTDMSRATDAREAGRIGVFGSSLSYGGSYGRVTSEAIGRDVNPLGRGSGIAYVGGSMNLGRISPASPLYRWTPGTGSSINNYDCSHCLGLGPGNSGFRVEKCETPGCEGEFCNEGCKIGWTSGSVATCCKDLTKGCEGPISAPAPQGQKATVTTQRTGPAMPKGGGGCSNCGGGGTPKAEGSGGDGGGSVSGDGGTGSGGDNGESEFWKNAHYDKSKCNDKGYAWSCCRSNDSCPIILGGLGNSGTSGQGGGMPGRTMGHVIFGNASDGPKALNAAFAMQSAMQGATIALLFPIQTAIAVRLLSKKKEEEEPPWYLGVWNDIGRFLVGGIHKTYTESEAGPFFNDVTKLVRCLHCAALTVDQFMGASNEEKFRYMCMLAVSSRDFDPSESDSIKTPTDCIAKDSKGHYLYSWDDVKQTLGIAGIDPARQSVHDAITSKTFHDLIESCGGAATPL